MPDPNAPDDAHAAPAWTAASPGPDPAWIEIRGGEYLIVDHGSDSRDRALHRRGEPRRV